MARIETAVWRGSGSGRSRCRAASHPTADPVLVRVLTAHLLALAAVAVASLLHPSDHDDAALTTVISTAFCFLHIASAGRRLSLSTLVLDAGGMALFVAGTGAASSAYVFLAMASTWWAANVPHRHGGSLWAATFAIGYATLTLPGATGGVSLLVTFEHVLTIVIIGVLADWIGHVDARAIALSEALAVAPAGAERVAIRDGLSRALAPMEISLDVLLAASRQGLTVIQAELLAYLVLGLTNQEIADATKVSVATVRYRLTRLYRALGVRGRAAARARAHAIGLAASGLGEPPHTAPFRTFLARQAARAELACASALGSRRWSEPLEAGCSRPRSGDRVRGFEELPNRVRRVEPSVAATVDRHQPKGVVCP